MNKTPQIVKLDFLSLLINTATTEINDPLTSSALTALLYNNSLSHYGGSGMMRASSSKSSSSPRGSHRLKSPTQRVVDPNDTDYNHTKKEVLPKSRLTLYNEFKNTIELYNIFIDLYNKVNALLIQKIIDIKTLIKSIQSIKKSENINNPEYTQLLTEGAKLEKLNTTLENMYSNFITHAKINSIRDFLNQFTIIINKNIV